MAGVPLHTHCGFTNSGPLYPACLLVGDLAPAVRQATRVLSDQEVTDLDALLQAPATLYDLQPMIPSATLYTRGLRIRLVRGEYAIYNLGPSVTPCNPTRLCAPMPLTSTDLVVHHCGRRGGVGRGSRLERPPTRRGPRLRALPAACNLRPAACNLVSV